MESNDKKRIYITAGILTLILVIAVIYAAVAAGPSKNAGSAGGGVFADSKAGASTGSASGTDTAEEKDDLSTGSATGTDTAEEKDDLSTSTGTATDAEQAAVSGLPAGSERAATKIVIASAVDTTATDSGTAATKTVIAPEGHVFFEASAVQLRDSYTGVPYDTEEELKTMLAYWGESNLPAVRDLVALPRYEAISATLKGTKDFYYYGERDGEGHPGGTGIAVYADNQYYYGSFSDGVRSGKGEWLQRYPSYMNDVVIEHYYTGEWADNQPNGMGQDHYEYNENRMKEDIIYLLNAIGRFKDGAYDGEMYLMIESPDGSYTEWSGVAEGGVFAITGETDTAGRIPIWNNRSDEDNHVWIKPEKNSNFRVRNLIVP